MGDPRHEEEEPDPAVLDKVPETVQPVVAGPVRQEQPALAFDGDEARRVAAWGRLRPAALARRRNHHEGRALDERPRVRVDAVHVLLGRERGRRSVGGPELFERLNGGHRRSGDIRSEVAGGAN